MGDFVKGILWRCLKGLLGFLRLSNIRISGLGLLGFQGLGTSLVCPKLCKPKAEYGFGVLVEPACYGTLQVCLPLGGLGVSGSLPKRSDTGLEVASSIGFDFEFGA